MQTVFDNDMTIHVWANESQPTGRNAGGSVSFENGTLKSYAAPIARHVHTKRGHVVLITTHHYSMTTARHIGTVHCACNHVDTFEVSDVMATPAECMKDYKSRYKALLLKYAKRKTAKTLESLNGLIETANKFSTFFGLKSRLAMPEGDFEAILDRARKREAKVRKAAAEYHASLEAEREEKRVAWLAGVSDYYPDNGIIRLRVKGDVLQTSMGADVPLDHAVKAFKTLKRLHAKGEAYQRNGHTIHLGHFALDAMDETGTVTAGCHKVEWGEIVRIANLVGVN
jgi:hypothetical protein